MSLHATKDSLTSPGQPGLTAVRAHRASTRTRRLPSMPSTDTSMKASTRILTRRPVVPSTIVQHL
eukprot:scaffold182886_cov19-Prasinocladus_malaysianus.AAC.1